MSDQGRLIKGTTGKNINNTIVCYKGELICLFKCSTTNCIIGQMSVQHHQHVVKHSDILMKKMKYEIEVITQYPLAVFFLSRRNSKDCDIANKA